MSTTSPAPTSAGATCARDGLLGEDQVVAEVVDPRAAVLLGHAEAERAERAELREELARHDAGALPLGIVRHDLLLDERADGLAVELVVFVEQVASHAGP